VWIKREKLTNVNPKSSVIIPLEEVVLAHIHLNKTTEKCPW